MKTPILLATLMVASASEAAISALQSINFVGATTSGGIAYTNLTAEPTFTTSLTAGPDGSFAQILPTTVSSLTYTTAPIALDVGGSVPLSITVEAITDPGRATTPDWMWGRDGTLTPGANTGLGFTGGNDSNNNGTRVARGEGFQVTFSHDVILTGLDITGGWRNENVNFSSDSGASSTLFGSTGATGGLRSNDLFEPVPSHLNTNFPTAVGTYIPGGSTFTVLASGSSGANNFWNLRGIQLVVIPEPSRALLLSAGILCLALRRRRP